MIFPLVATLAVFVGVFCAIRALGPIVEGLLVAQGPVVTERLDGIVTQALGREADGAHIVARVVAVVLPLAVTVAILSASPILGIALAGLVVAVPTVLFKRAETRFQTGLERSLPIALQQVANEMAARPSLEQALEAVSRTAAPPANTELLLLQRKIESLGLDLALEQTSKKLRNRSFTLMASVLRVGGQQGGKLSESLKKLSRTLIEIQRLNEKIETARNESRNIFRFLSAIGLLIILGAASMPGAASVLDTPTGRIAATVALALYIGGILLARRMMKISV